MSTLVQDYHSPLRFIYLKKHMESEHPTHLDMDNEPFIYYLVSTLVYKF